MYAEAGYHGLGDTETEKKSEHFVSDRNDDVHVTN